jgi:hypothetical protein
MMKALICVLGLTVTMAGLSVVGAGQTPSAESSPQGSASITGLVTIDGHPAPGVMLSLSQNTNGMQDMLQRLSRGAHSERVRTDGGGTYRFEGLPTGHYQVQPMMPALIENYSNSSGGEVSIVDGDSVEGINFAFNRGAVITGTITTADGRPVTAATVVASPIFDPNAKLEALALKPGNAETDDRGVFRIYGLNGGKFTVSVAGSGGAASGGPSIPDQTFYPGVTDKAAARAVQVATGAEISGIDMKVGAAVRGYEVTGRVVDDSGKPVPDMMVSYGASVPGGKGLSSSGSGSYTSSAGEFKIERVQPGNYSASASFAGQTDSDFYSDSTSFEVKSANVTGIEVKVHKGITVSGAVVIQGTDDPQAASQLSQTQVAGFSDQRVDTAVGFSRSDVAPDGTFVLKGLPPGKLRISLGFLTPGPFSIITIERGGATVTDGLQLSVGDQISDLRIVVGYANCSISGQVSIQGGKLPQGANLTVAPVLQSQDGTSSSAQSFLFPGANLAEVEPDGRFQLDHLLPGDYQLTLSATIPSGQGSPKVITVTQAVTLTSGDETKVTLSLDLSASDTNQSPPPPPPQPPPPAS